MRQRDVSEDDIVEVLLNPGMTWYDPEEESMALSGPRGPKGTVLVWVVGDHWPLEGMLIVKSTARRRT